MRWISAKAKAEFYYYLFSESGFDDKLNIVAADNYMVRLIDIEKIVEYQAQYSQSESNRSVSRAAA